MTDDLAQAQEPRQIDAADDDDDTPLVRTDSVPDGDAVTDTAANDKPQEGGN
jgi:hypothetical protein